MRYEHSECSRGHEYNHHNTYFNANGRPFCRLCRKARCRRRKRALRAGFTPEQVAQINSLDGEERMRLYQRIWNANQRQRTADDNFRFELWEVLREIDNEIREYYDGLCSTFTG